MPATDQILKFVGELIAYGGGSAAIAYLTFQFLGQRWIENKFAEKLEQLRHTQALELQRLRLEIDSMLSGAIKTQDKEFETLPEAWVLLDEAYSRVTHLISPSQKYTDLDRMKSERLEEFLAASDLLESHKNELRQEKKKNEAYLEIIFWQSLNDVQRAISKLHNYIERNSIFTPPDLKGHFEKTSNDLWLALISKKVGHKAKDWKMQNEGWDKIKTEIEPLRKNIGEAIYFRLQAHGKSTETINIKVM
jgi:hypothetical protein